MEEKLRTSGIDVIGDIPWGTHFCQFYKTKEDLTDILVPYFKAGLENNEFCIWITSQPLEVEEAKKILKRSVPDIDNYLEKGQIEIIPYTYWYVQEGSFDSERILNGWIEKLNQALADGYEGLRLSGNTFWLEKEDWNDFVQYEEEVDNIIGNYQMIALCTYCLEKCNSTEIVDVVINHQFALIKREEKWDQIESSRRKKAEETAIQALKDWKYTFDAVPDLIAILDTEYRIIRANKAMAERLELASEACAGLTCYRAVHQGSEPPSFCPHRLLLKDGLEHTEEVFEDCLGGYFMVSVSPLHDAEGKLIGSVHVARDVNKRKLAEEALVRSENKFRTLAENSPDVIARFDRQNRHLYANPAAAETYGKLTEEIIGKTYAELGMEPERAKLWERYNETVFTTGKPETVEFHYKSPEGKEYYFNTRIVPEFVDEEVVSVLAISRGITDIKEAESKLKETLDNLEKLIKERTVELEKACRSLKESEEWLAEAQKMAHLGNWNWNIVTNQLYWSDEIYRIFGRSPQEFGATYDSFLTYVHPDDRSYVNSTVVGALKGKPYSIEHRIISAQGEERTVLEQGEVIFDEKNRPIRMKGTVQDITERKKAEEMLKESEGKLKALFRLLPVGVSITDKDRNILDVNLALEKILGISRSDLLNKKYEIRKYLRSNGTEMPFEEIPSVRALEEKGSIQSSEVGIKKEDCSIVWTDVSAIALPFSEVVITTRDITDSKKAKEELQKSEERYRIVTEQTGQLVYDRDLRTRKSNWAGNIEKVTGYSSQEFNELSSEAWIEHIHPEDRDCVLKKIGKIREKGGNYGAEFRFRKKDGTYFHAENSEVYLVDEAGLPYRVLGVMKDITERKIAVEKLKISEERIQSYLQNFRGIGTQLDKDFVPIFLHGAVEELTGYTKEDFLSGKLHWRELVEPEDLTGLLEKAQRMKNTPDSIVNHEYRIRKKDGEIRWIHGIAQNISEKNKELYQGLMYDITERKMAEEALVAMKESRIKEIHHRIKNNLQVISSLLDLQAEKFEDRTVRQAFRESQNRVISMALIHEELYESGEIGTLNFAAYLQNLAEYIFKSFNIRDLEAHLHLKVEEKTFLDMDTAVPLGIIVNELVSNSLRHAFPEKEKGMVKIRLFREEKGEFKSNSVENLGIENNTSGNNRIEDIRVNNTKKDTKSPDLILTISDNGVGMPESVDIESPCTLGLQLVTILVDQLEGELELKRDSGTEFRIKMTAKEKK